MGRKRILLVDDEEDLLKAMRIRLDSWGYDVITATSGKEALRLVKDGSPDAVVLDIVMPEMNGVETLRRIRRINKKVPVLMLTAYASEEKIQNTEHLGISAFIVKGAEFGNASDLIRTALKGAV